MSFSFLKRLTLVGRGGLGLARIPKEGDAEIQLQSGLLSAIMSYSKEVHQSELEGLTMHDRTLSIIKINDYNLIVEFSNAIDKGLMNRILQQMEQEVGPVLNDNQNRMIGEAEAQLLLEMISKQEWMDNVLNNFGLDRPLNSGKIVSAGIITTNDQYINTVINKLDNFDRPFMLPLSDEKICLYVVPMDKSYYYLQLPISKEIQLFRLAPLLRREYHYLNPMNLDPKTVMDRMKTMPDLGFQLEQAEKDMISLKFLKDNVRKRLDAGIDGIIKGKSVVVIGEKITVKIVVNTLQIFTQHLHTNVNPWLGEDSEDVPEGTTGMNPKKFNDLNDKGLIKDNVIIINLEEKRVKNGRDNKFIQHYMKDVEKQNIDEVIEDVRKRLDDVVMLSLKLTEYLSLPTDVAKGALTNLQKEISNGDEFDFVISLASQRNEALETVIHDLSKTLQKAESFLGEF